MSWVDVLAVMGRYEAECAREHSDLTQLVSDGALSGYEKELADLDQRLRDAQEARAAIAELVFAAEQMRIDLNITRSNIMAEIMHGRDKWDGVPEILEHRINACDAALSRVRGSI